MSRTTLLFGPPGTGKTTALLDEVDAALAAGVPPDKIAFVSFTRKAAREAVERAIGRFPEAGDADFTWFRTLHSLAFKRLGLKRDEVMQAGHWRDLGAALGYPFTASYDETTERAPLYGGLGDKCLSIYSLARARMVPVEQAWRELTLDDVALAHVTRFERALNAYKGEHGLLDFSDFLDLVHDPMELDLLIIDEAQDLTAQQWAFARRIGAKARRVIIAGDDDQAIFTWAGADLKEFLSIGGNVRVLPKSYRLPSLIWDRVNAISQRIRVRKAKDWEPASEGGVITHLDEPAQADLTGDESWLLMTRNRYHLKEMVGMCRDQGVVYHHDGRWSNQADSVQAVVLYERLRKGGYVTGRQANLVARMVPGMPKVHGVGDEYGWADLAWPFEGDPPWMEALTAMGADEREYIRKLRRQGESLFHPGRVTLSTIHAAKGGEADNVVLPTDMSRRVYDGAMEAPDNEARVWYVGASRARRALHLVRPRSPRFFTI